MGFFNVVSSKSSFLGLLLTEKCFQRLVRKLRKCIAPLLSHTGSNCLIFSEYIARYMSFTGHMSTACSFLFYVFFCTRRGSHNALFMSECRNRSIEHHFHKLVSNVSLINYTENIIILWEQGQQKVFENSGSGFDWVHEGLVDGRWVLWCCDTS